MIQCFFFILREIKPIKLHILFYIIKHLKKEKNDWTIDVDK